LKISINRDISVHFQQRSSIAQNVLVNSIVPINNDCKWKSSAQRRLRLEFVITAARRADRSKYGDQPYAMKVAVRYKFGKVRHLMSILTASVVGPERARTLQGFNC